MAGRAVRANPDPRSGFATLTSSGYENATQPRYRWDEIGAQWRGLFDEVLAA